MSIAAIPKYLGDDFTSASPGMRFGMYLRLWNPNNTWTLEKPSAFDHVKTLTDGDQQIMKNLLKRQISSFDGFQPAIASLRLAAQATAPFTTGLGNAHPLENGFAFLNPYGLPYLPGSGIKGVLRQAARELASGDWGDTHGWSAADVYPLFITGKSGQREQVKDTNKQPVMLSLLDLLFGRESKDGETTHLRGALSFWDVIPQIPGKELMVEVMTPHQGQYYQGKTNPHDSGQPTPIQFLTLPPKSIFTFHVVCDTAHLMQHAPELAAYEAWQTLLIKAFEHAFDWLGFGAKTAIGYGAMQRDKSQEAKLQQAGLAIAKQREEEKRLANLSPEELDRDRERQIIEAFRQKFETANKSSYQPGGNFDNDRQKFIQEALQWNDAHSRHAAAALIEKTMTKSWGMPGKAERKKKIQDAIQALQGNLV